MQYFRNHDSGRTFKRVQSEVQKAGYWFRDKNAVVLNTAEHTDIPQHRDRPFMVAYSCDNFPSNTFEFSKPFAGKMRPVTSFLDRKLLQAGIAIIPAFPSKQWRRGTPTLCTSSAGTTSARTCRANASR